MSWNRNAIVVSYPNQVGDHGRYELRDQRAYFSKFDGSASHIFELALYNNICGDLIAYTEQCCEIFDAYTNRRFEENTLSMDQYHDEHREFNRRIFDIYRFSKNSLNSLGSEVNFTGVKLLKRDRKFDTASFVLSYLSS